MKGVSISEYYLCSSISFETGSILIPKTNLFKKLQSVINIHLWKLNSYIYRACTSYTTFNAAKIKLILRFFFFSFELKICIKIDIKPGHIDLNILFREVWDSLMNNILMQKSIKISKAGEEFSYFITSFKNSKTVLNLPSYLSILPEYMTKHILSNDLIFCRRTSSLPFSKP